MTFKEFIQKYDGKGLNYDNAYGNQCTDLFRFYCKLVLEIEQPKGVVGAKDFFEKFDSDPILVKNFKKVVNTPEGVPEEGDVIIWKATSGNPYGHVAICISASKTKFVSFDQNWTNLQLCKQVSHTYSNVLGWLKPLQISNTMKPSEKLPDEFYQIKEFKDLKEMKVVKGDEAWDTVCSLLLSYVESLNVKTREVQKQIDLFEEQKKGWEESKQNALDSQKKEYISKIDVLSEKVASLEAQLKCCRDTSTPPTQSAKYKFNLTDFVGWMKNVGLFGLLPLTVAILVSFTGVIPQDTIYGVIGLALLNALIDFIKKLLKDNGDTNI